jgi:hypothetical protein
MDSKLLDLVARCQATIAQTAKLLEDNAKLQEQTWVTLAQIRIDRAARSNMAPEKRAWPSAPALMVE